MGTVSIVLNITDKMRRQRKINRLRIYRGTNRSILFRGGRGWKIILSEKKEGKQVLIFWVKHYRRFSIMEG